MDQGRRHPAAPIDAAAVVLPCADLAATLAFFTGRLGFRLDSIEPADDPIVAEISGHGVRLCLQRGADAPAGVLRLLVREPAAFGGGAGELLAPNGTRIQFAAAAPAPPLPPLRPSLVVARANDASWREGRAGMRYRDLIPDRQGGRFIASHIHLPAGGPVPDYVHFHRVRVQLLHCWRGQARVVYEDQGPPFVLEAGDCVLQPPAIRHRVLDCSPGFEVIELACPAAHATVADHDLGLPTPRARRDRDFGGQRFVHARAAAATWGPWRHDGFVARELGIDKATAGLAGARVVRAAHAAAATPTGAHDAELLFHFVLRGAVTLRTAARDPAALAPGDACMVPAGMPSALTAASADLELLEVALPAAFSTALR